MKTSSSIALASVAVLTAVLVAFGDADAQRFDARKPRSFVVGSPKGPSPMARVDARRSAKAKDPLPSGPLRVAWRKAIGLSIEQPALSGGSGTLVVVTSRGDVVFLDDGGQERGKVTVAAGSVGPAALISDGTVVFVTSSGDAIGVRASSPTPRFVTRVGGERNVRAAPLPLDDGGIVVATSTDLVLLDGGGDVRTRTTLPEAIGAPLLSDGGRVLAVSVTGTVFAWVPGRDAVRVASFGSSVDGGCVLADPTTLVGVIEGNHLAAIDLSHGTLRTRAVAPQGLYLGPPAAFARGNAPAPSLALLALGPLRGFVVVVDAADQEALRAPISTFTSSVLPDGGAAPLVAPAHVGPLVDDRGAIAFAATDGHVGLVSEGGAVETIGDLLCSEPNRSTSGVTGLTPAGPGSFVVTCDRGAIVKIAGDR